MLSLRFSWENISHHRLYLCANLTYDPLYDVKHHRKVCKFVMDPYAAIVLACCRQRHQNAFNTAKGASPGSRVATTGTCTQRYRLHSLYCCFCSNQFYNHQSSPHCHTGTWRKQVEDHFGTRCLYAHQEEQLGTGHAVLAAVNTIHELNPSHQTILVCYGDTPLIIGQILARVLVEHLTNQATLTFLTAISEQPSDFGRVVREAHGQVREIVGVKRDC
jgi:hypothetical protein